MRRVAGLRDPLPPCSPTAGQDVADTIVAHLKAPRTRKQVICHLVRLGLADSVRDFQR